MSLRVFSCFVLLLLALGCNLRSSHGNDPKDRLAAYIEKSFAVKSVSDKADLLGFLTGEAKTRLSGWSDDQFQQAFIDQKREFSKLLVRDVKSLTSEQVQLTYELSYIDKSKNTGAKVTQRKLAEMIKQDGVWKIGNVHNLNELVEFKDALSLP